MAADKITEIVDQSAFEQVEKLKKDMTTLAATFVDLFKQANAFNDALKSAKGIPEFKAQAAGASKATNELDRVLNELSKTREKLSISENRWTQALAESRLALQQINQETKDSVKLNLAAEGSVDQMRLQLKSLQNQWYALGKSAREAMGPGLLNNIQRVDTELKKLENSTGRYQRSVGNYKNETFQLSQVIRELPAFTYSATTGILALSNNLPMLGDAFAKVKNEIGPNGKPNGAIGALSIFGKSLLSLPNIFAIAVGLFTIYSKEIFEFIKGTDSAEESVRKFNQSLEGMRQALTNVNDQIEFGNDMIDKESKLLLARAKARGDDEGARKIAIEAEKRGISEKIRLLNDELEKLAGIKRVYEDRQRIKNVNSSAMPESKEEISKMLEETYKMERDLIKKRSDLIIDLQIKELGARTAGKATKGGKSPKEVNRVDDLAQAYDNEIKVTQKKYSELYKTEAEWQQKLLEINYDYAAKKLNGIENLSKKEADSRIDFDDKILKSTTDTVDKMAKAVDDQTKKDIDNAKRALKARIDANKDRLKDEEDTCKDIDAAGERAWKLQKERQDKALEEAKKLNEAKRSLAQSELEFANTIGTLIFDAIATRAQREHDKRIEFIDREEKAQIDSLSRRTLTDKQRAEETKKIELSAQSEREKAHRQEVTRLRKAAVYQKALDTASIIASTAIAVMSALGAKPYTPANIALAAGAGIAGATQLARVIAAPLPQYADGTEWHYGGGFIAGEGKDGKGAVELVTTPDGRSFFTPAQATFYPDMPVGTKVKSNEELIQDIYKTAMIKLSNVGPVTTSKMEEAMLASFERYEDKLDTLTDAVRDIKMSATFENFSDHISHVKSRVR